MIAAVSYENAGTKLYQTKTVQKGEDLTVYAPHVAGYVLTTAGSKAFTNLTADDSATFVYKLGTDDYVTLTVTGSDGANSLYTYTSLVPKSTATTVHASSIPGYVLDTTRTENYSNGTLSGTLGEREITLSANGSHVFYYKKNTATVTVDFLDQATGITISGKTAQTVTGTIGESITVNAPVIADYELITTETATKSHTDRKSVV